MIEFVKANPSDAAELAVIADEIWHQHFTGIISEGQIDYMLEKFQCEPVMKEQMSHGYEYYFFCIDGKNQGYFAVQQQEDTLFLSKIYLRKSFRGNGYARKAFEVIEKIIDERKLKKLWLTVNIHNNDTIAVYKALGMEIARTQKADIGCGYVMDDYIFEKKYSF